MARVLANLLDENEQRVLTLQVESVDHYAVNRWFEAPGGGRYVIAEVKRGTPPNDIELTAVWMDGPHPTTLVGRHS